MRIPIRRLHELGRRFKSIRRGAIRILKHRRASSQFVDIGSGLPAITVGTKVIGPQRIYKEIDYVVRFAVRPRSNIQLAPLSLPIFQLLPGQIAAYTVVIRVVFDYFILSRVNTRRAIISIASAEVSRVTVPVEIEKPLREHEMLFRLCRASKHLGLQ